jgi:hypothetical protein
MVQTTLPTSNPMWTETCAVATAKLHVAEHERWHPRTSTREQYYCSAYFQISLADGVIAQSNLCEVARRHGRRVKGQ